MTASAGSGEFFFFVLSKLASRGLTSHFEMCRRRRRNDMADSLRQYFQTFRGGEMEEM